MQVSSTTSSKIEPFAFQNRTVYQDLLRMMSTVREAQSETQTDLGKIFMHNLFESLYSISKEIGYSTINESEMAKMDLTVSCIAKIFDCMTALDVCFNARWIPSLQYFESKQILEKAYWTFCEDQKTTTNPKDIKFSQPNFIKSKQFQ